MDKITMKGLMVILLLGMLVFAPMVAHAQSALEVTHILMGAPTQAALGEPFTVQAVLADSKGHAIPKAVVYFTQTASFLGETNNMDVAQAVTNAKGQVSAQITNNQSGTITLNAEFRGDTQYAPSIESFQVTVTGVKQLYNEHIGVDIPGLNTPPFAGSMQGSLQRQPGIVGFIEGLWPMLNSWPIALVLAIVWSMYLVAVRYIFRVAALASEKDESAAAGSRS
jgi:hypothetical protein